MTAMGVEAMLDVPANGVGGHQAASRLAQCSREARAAGVRWDALYAPTWQGQAAVGYDLARADVSRYVRDLADVSDALSGAVRAYADDMAAVLPAWRDAVQQWEQARSTQLNAADPLAVESAGAALVDAETRVLRCQTRYEEAGTALADAARAAMAALPPLSEAGRQINDATAALITVGLVEPVKAVGYLTVGWISDPQGWWQTISSTPSDTARAALNAARHPVDASRGAGKNFIDYQHWNEREWGTAVGTVAANLTAIVTPKGIVRALKVPERPPDVDADVLARFPSAVFDRTRPQPQVQTFDEMLTDGVDLTRHEHSSLGHTLRRHVDVSDEYLVDRVTNGTIEDTGHRGGRPPFASVWNDAQTAQMNITRALRMNEVEIREQMALEPNRRRWLEYEVESADGLPLGRSVPVNSPLSREDQTSFVLRIRWDEAGAPVVLTAYPGTLP